MASLAVSGTEAVRSEWSRVQMLWSSPAVRLLNFSEDPVSSLLLSVLFVCLLTDRPRSWPRMENRVKAGLKLSSVSLPSSCWDDRQMSAYL